MFEAEEIRLLMAAADPVMRAMILLAINCGYGNHDVGQLPRSVVDLESGWITWPRPKTRVERRAPLWPETVEAMRSAIPLRPKPKAPEDERFFFLTRTGTPWHKDSETFISGPLSQAFRKLLGKTKLHRPGNGFYSFRRTFETIAGENGDQVAVDRIMGHADNSMAATSRSWNRSISWPRAAARRPRRIRAVGRGSRTRSCGLTHRDLAVRAVALWVSSGYLPSLTKNSGWPYCDTPKSRIACSASGEIRKSAKRRAASWRTWGCFRELTMMTE